MEWTIQTVVILILVMIIVLVIALVIMSWGSGSRGIVQQIFDLIRNAGKSLNIQLP